jgi:hypothetical protein
VETTAWGAQKSARSFNRLTNAKLQQALPHVSGDPDHLKVGSVDEEKLPESRGQTRAAEAVQAL